MIAPGPGPDHAPRNAGADQHGRALALLLATEQMFARRLDDADLLLTTLADLVGQIGLTLDGSCALFLVEDGEAPLRLIDLYRADPAERERQRIALQANPPRLDTGTLAEIARSGAGQIGLRIATGTATLTSAAETALAVSLHHDGRSYGLLILWRAAASPPGADELRLCEAIGRRIAVALAEAGLAQSAQTARDLLTGSPDPAFRLSIGGRILDANAAFCRLLGFTPGQLAERHIGDLMAPEERDSLLELLASTTITGPPLMPRDWTLVRATGERRVIEIRGRALSNLGQPIEIHCAGRDLTARREDQRALARQGTELATLHIAGLALADALEPGEIRQALLSALRAALPCDDVTIYALDRGAMQPEMALQTDGGTPPDFPHGHRLIDESVGHGQSVLLNDAPSEPEFAAGTTVSPLHLLIAPLLASGRVSGCIVLRRMRGDPFTLNDLRLVESIAIPAALTLQNARLYAERSGTATDLRTVLESVQQGILLTDRAGRVRFANRRFGELFGIDVRTIIGWHDLDIAQRLLAPRAREPKTLLARLAWLDEHPEERSTDEVALSRATGQILERYTGPMRDPENRVTVGRIVVYTDVTATRQLERAKDEFLATASHELKTPITTLGGYLELLERQVARPAGPDPARLARYVGSARGELGRLRRLSEDLLEVARIEAGRLQLQLEAADLAQTVRDTVERFVRRPGLEDRGHRLVCDAAEALPTLHDTLRIGQVVSNLIENALKYSPDGGDVIVTARRDGEHAVISVRDSGIGVPEDEREQLFLPFYRTANASAGSPEGLGLGLYISRGIVEGPGGRIWTEAADERGTIFVLTLPLV